MNPEHDTLHDCGDAVWARALQHQGRAYEQFEGSAVGGVWPRHADLRVRAFHLLARPVERPRLPAALPQPAATQHQPGGAKGLPRCLESLGERDSARCVNGRRELKAPACTAPRVAGNTVD